MVAVRLPMSLRLESLHAAPEQQALLYGPVVLAGDLGREGLEKINLIETSQTRQSNAPVPPAPVFVGSRNDVLKSIRRVPGRELLFEARLTDGASGAPRTVALMPFSRAHHRRYGVYWSVYEPVQWQARREEMAAEEKRQRDLALRTLDEFRPGEQQSETDHALRAEKSNTGEANGRRWRDAGDGGSISFELKVLPDAPNALLVTYWGGETGNRLFDILIDGTKIATQKLAMDRPGQFFDREYAIPEAATRGKQKVTVRLQAAPGAMAGGLFGARMLKR